jgi:hypothetical protein
MSTPLITKGSSFILSSGSTELKSIIVEDPTPAVGEGENTEIVSHDGTKYTTVGTIGENTAEFVVLQTKEEFAAIMTMAYGTPSITGSTSTWNLTNPGTTTGTVTILSPKTSGSPASQTSWILINAKALSVVPALPIGGFATMRVKMTGDNWQSKLNTNA